MRLNIDVFAFLLIFSIFIIQPVFADEEEPIISINIIGESEFYLDSENNMIRAEVVIENYTPSDGFYYMLLTNSTGDVVKETEILPKDKGNDMWGTQFAHMITSKVPETFQILIYSEYGTATATTTVSLLETKSSVQQAVKEVDEQTPEPEQLVTPEVIEPQLIEEPEQKLPDWVRDIFIWYAEGQIGEEELIGALQFLIEEGIIEI